MKILKKYKFSLAAIAFGLAVTFIGIALKKRERDDSIQAPPKELAASPEAPTQPAAGTAGTDSPSTLENSKGSQETSVEPSTQEDDRRRSGGVREQSDRYFSSTRLENDPEYYAKVQKHLAVRNHQNSPARHTKECQQMLRLLTEAGYGIEVLADAYNATWNLKILDDMNREAPPDYEYPIRLHREIFKKQEWERLLKKHALEDYELFESIVKIVPKVFYGTFDSRLVEGEELLSP